MPFSLADYLTMTVQAKKKNYQYSCQNLPDIQKEPQVGRRHFLFELYANVSNLQKQCA